MAQKPQVKCKCRRVAAFPIRAHRRRKDWRVPHASEVEQFARRGRIMFETANAVGRLSDQCRFLAKTDFQLRAAPRTPQRKGASRLAHTILPA
jgi:hypothetical protein